MANPLTNFFRDRFIKPEVDRETSALKKQINSQQLQLEHKQFDLLGEVSQRFGARSDSDRYQTINAYVSWVYANITVIAEQVADINFELYQLVGTGGKEQLDVVPQHDVLDLLLRVNDYQTKWDLIYLWTYYMLSCGEAVWYLVGRTTPNAKPTEIWTLRPDYIKVIPGDLSKNEMVARYEYRIPGKPMVTFQPSEILFFKMPNPLNNYRGYGVVEAAAADIAIDEAATNYNKRFFENYARPEGVLQTDQKLDEDIIDRLSTRWSTRFKGSDNAGKTAVLEQGLDYKIIQQTAKDMDFLNQQSWTRDKIMALFKNSRVALGITENVNRANAEASENVWLKHNIKPKMQRLVDSLNEFLVPIYGSNLILGFTDPLPETQELKIAEYSAGIDKWLTRNEVRQREGLDPVQGGDSLYVAFTDTPVGSTTPAPEGTPPAPPAKSFAILPVEKIADGRKRALMVKYAKDIQRVKNRRFREKKLKNVVNKILTQAVETIEVKPKGVLQPPPKGQALSKELKQSRWEARIKLSQKYENQVVAVVEHVISHHKAKTLQLVNQNFKSLHTKGVEDFLPDDSEFVTASVDAMLPIFSALAAEQGKDVYDFLGVNQQFSAGASLDQQLREMALQSSTSYIGTLGDKIRNALADGVNAGEGIDKLSQRLIDTYGGFTKYTAQRVARTETDRAANATSLDAYGQSGVVESKQWFTAGDDQVDDECDALEGQIVALDEQFDGGYDAPPAHVNCRCDISPVLSDATDAGLTDNSAIDFTNSQDLQDAFDYTDYADMSQLDRNSAVEQNFSDTFPTLAGYASQYNWTPKVVPIDQLKVFVAGVPSKVDEYVRAFKNGDKFPTMFAARIGGQLTLLDGAHRIEALQQLGATKVPILVGIPNK